MEILLILPGFILAIIIMVIYEIKLRKPQNKVRFFIKRIEGVFYFNIRNKEHSYLLCSNINFREWDLNPSDFADMDDGEIREVFLNSEG